jgi:hypothetical protein
MMGTIKIPNPTIMTITVGDVVQDIYSAIDDTPIGNTTINNMILRPGDNYFPLVSGADQAKVITIITNDKSKSGVLAVAARARTVTYNGERLRYFEEAMKAVPIKINLNLKEALKTIGLDLSNDDTTAPPPPPPTPTS